VNILIFGDIIIVGEEDQILFGIKRTIASNMKKQ